jgi:hypothetical protein
LPRTKAQRILDALTKAHRDWVQKNLNHIWERDSSDLNDKLNGNSLQDLTACSFDLGSISLCHATKGIVSLLDGDTGAWELLNRACLFQYWSARIDFDVYFRTKFLAQYGPLPMTHRTKRVAHILAFSLARGLDDWQRYATWALLKCVVEPGAVNKREWAEESYEPFLLRLLNRVYGQPLPEEIMERDLGVYRPVLDHWDDPEALAAPLAAICDFHCRHMNYRGGYKCLFDDPPFDLIPCEILAIRRLRSDAGLATPVVDHPLLATPLAEMPSGPLDVRDELLDRVKALHAEYFPNDDGATLSS